MELGLGETAHKKISIWISFDYYQIPSICVLKLINLNKMPLSGIHGEPGIQRSKVIPHLICNSIIFTTVTPLFLIAVCVIPSPQVSSADEVVKTMISHMTNPDSQSHLPIKSGALITPRPLAVSFFLLFVFECNELAPPFNTGDRVVVCVNNLGALSVLEMSVITRAAIICLGNDG